MDFTFADLLYQAEILSPEQIDMGSLHETMIQMPKDDAASQSFG